MALMATGYNLYEGLATPACMATLLTPFSLVPNPLAGLVHQFKQPQAAPAGLGVCVGFSVPVLE